MQKTIANFRYAGTGQFVTHAVNEQISETLCGMDFHELQSRDGQEWEYDETNEPNAVGCKKCLKKMEKP